jgi:hypothetical protein
MYPWHSNNVVIKKKIIIHVVTRSYVYHSLVPTPKVARTWFNAWHILRSKKCWTNEPETKTLNNHANFSLQYNNIQLWTIVEQAAVLAYGQISVKLWRQYKTNTIIFFVVKELENSFNVLYVNSLISTINIFLKRIVYSYYVLFSEFYKIPILNIAHCCRDIPPMYTDRSITQLPSNLIIEVYASIHRHKTSKKETQLIPNWNVLDITSFNMFTI